MPKAVIFDVDGTLVDSVDLHARAWQEAFQEFGHPVAFEAVRYQIGKGGDQLLPVFLSAEQIDIIGKPLESYRAELFSARYFSKVRSFERIRNLFERITQDGARIALASSAKGSDLERYKIIADIADLVDAQTSSDDAEKSKPYPDIFEAALNRLGDVCGSDCVVVGDTPYDVEAAGRAGIGTIGLLCGGWSALDLKRAGAIGVYRDAADLLDQYEQSPLARS